MKIGQHQSTAVQLEVGVPQGSVLGPIVFAVYASPVAADAASHGVQYRQYADDTQLRLAMRADNTSAGLSVLAACTADVPAAQPGQIRSTDRRNGTPATRCDINRVVRHCRRRRSAATQRNEGARSHPRSAPDFREARFSSCAIVQLPQPSHPPYSLSADDSTCTDAWL